MRDCWRRCWPHAALLSAAALSLALTPTTAAAQATVSVFVPGYRASAWEGLRGSVITSVGDLSLFKSPELSSVGSMAGL